MILAIEVNLVVVKRLKKNYKGIQYKKCCANKKIGDFIIECLNKKLKNLFYL